MGSIGTIVAELRKGTRQIIGADEACGVLTNSGPYTGSESDGRIVLCVSVYHRQLSGENLN